jgi:hypothetical protein
MRLAMRRRLLGPAGLVLVLAAVALVPAEQAQARPQTTAPTVFFNIRVTLTNARIIVDKHRAPRGTYARFVIRNVGTRPLNFTLGKAKRGTGAQSGFSRTLKPRERQILLLFLDYRGAIPYSSRLAADRAKPGMKGVFTIGGCIAQSVGC